jgi:hypothetical protein
MAALQDAKPIACLKRLANTRGRQRSGIGGGASGAPQIAELQ